MLNVDLLNINPDTVCHLILRAREFHAKEEVSFPERTPESEYEYDWAQILANHEDDLTYREIKNAIHSLPYEKQLDLLALMYLGREDFDEWDEALKAAISNFPSDLTDYLLAHPLIAVYLEQALAKLGYSCDE